MATEFPTATILGYPRIGRRRELKRAVESYWAGRSTAEELTSAFTALRHATFDRLAELGYDRTDSSIPENSSLYDQVLDVTWQLGAIPQRFTGKNELDLYFALARGDQDVPPLEMTKWFDTNYHYLVPEIGPDTPISFANDHLVQRFVEAKNAGTLTRPVVVGPVTYLALAKAADDAPEGFEPLDRIDDVVAAYRALVSAFGAAGATWVQFDEPALVSDNLSVSRVDLAEIAGRVWPLLAALEDRPSLLLALPYGDGRMALPAIAGSGVEAIQLDLVRGSAPVPGEVDLSKVRLVAGLIDGRNIWRADLAAARDALIELEQLGAAGISVATTNSLQHMPHDTADEKWGDAELNANLHDWLAFADQKVAETAVLARGLSHGWDSVTADIAQASTALAARAIAPGVRREDVRTRTAALTEADRTRIPFTEREPIQAQKLGLPILPTTTIGSFPQTPEIRNARAALNRGEIDEAGYTERIRGEVAKVIKLQEDLDIDVLVHGEPERNDMVQYFAEQFDGFAATRNGWVQSYGSRCTRPSIQWGDVARPAPMTVEWTSYAQSLTGRPVKGMLTGPVTILAWSFPRIDIPLGESADQIALALRDEVADLEAAGTSIIQVDEPALRELLPLDADRQADYLDWSVGSFRAATAGVRPDTQIHTHLCYSEFGQIIDAIAGLDADVTSIEAARSKMEVLPELAANGFFRGVGPGVWDIHSPRVPSTDELVELIQAAAQSVPANRLWVNPDCGLKTRAYPETNATLANLVEATKIVRAELA
ncbi:MAG: 5-methyltetrahydropteroyltriglutamate--homocysteine S-methyltransferase [Ancrocorticia sp.]|nr:5-methyltetrahydropteroyltriglutamate--homocysteine S-methyltransferase [Ancrocorticia sp.]